MEICCTFIHIYVLEFAFESIVLFELQGFFKTLKKVLSSQHSKFYLTSFAFLIKNTVILSFFIPMPYVYIRIAILHQFLNGVLSASCTVLRISQKHEKELSKMAISAGLCTHLVSLTQG